MGSQAPLAKLQTANICAAEEALGAFWYVSPASVHKCVCVAFCALMGSTQRKECLLKVSECLHFLLALSCILKGRDAMRCNQVCLIFVMCDLF